MKKSTLIKSSTPNVPAILPQDVRAPHALLSHHPEPESSREEKVSKETNSSLRRKAHGNSSLSPQGKT